MKRALLGALCAFLAACGSAPPGEGTGTTPAEDAAPWSTPSETTPDASPDGSSEASNTLAVTSSESGPDDSSFSTSSPNSDAGAPDAAACPLDGEACHCMPLGPACQSYPFVCGMLCCNWQPPHC
jgi:hypothetical protein